MNHWIIHSSDLFKNTDSGTKQTCESLNHSLNTCVAWRDINSSAVSLFGTILVGKTKVTGNIVSASFVFS